MIPLKISNSLQTVNNINKIKEKKKIIFKKSLSQENIFITEHCDFIHRHDIFFPRFRKNLLDSTP